MDLIFKRKYCPNCRKNRYVWKKSFKKYVIQKTKGTRYFCERCNFKIRKKINK